MRKLKKYKPTKLMAKSSHYDEQMADSQSYSMKIEKRQETATTKK